MNVLIVNNALATDVARKCLTLSVAQQMITVGVDGGMGDLHIAVVVHADPKLQTMRIAEA